MSKIWAWVKGRAGGSKDARWKLFALTFSLFPVLTSGNIAAISTIEVNENINQSMQRVVIFVDGKEIIHYTDKVGTEEILADAKINVGPLDEIILPDPLHEVVTATKITINRANAVAILADGKTIAAQSWGKNVGQILAQNGISVGQTDRVEPGLGEAVYSGMTISVIRVTEGQITEKVVIAREVQTENDANLEVGRTVVKQEGQDGQKEVTYQVRYENGGEVARQVLSQNILSNPVTKIVVKGTKPKYVGPLWPLVVEAGAKYGVDPGLLNKIMMCESGGNVYSTNKWGGYYGLFQFSKSTWAGTPFGGYDIYDPWAQINAAAWKIAHGGIGAWPVCSKK